MTTAKFSNSIYYVPGPRILKNVSGSKNKTEKIRTSTFVSASTVNWTFLEKKKEKKKKKERERERGRESV